MAFLPSTNEIHNIESTLCFLCVCVCGCGCGCVCVCVRERERERDNTRESRPIPAFSDAAMMHVQYLKVLKCTDLLHRTPYIQTPHISVYFLLLQYFNTLHNDTVNRKALTAACTNRISFDNVITDGHNFKKIYHHHQPSPFIP